MIAPTIAGVELSDGRAVGAQHQLGGGPSVLFDAVAILVSDEAADADLFVDPCRALRRWEREAAA